MRCGRDKRFACFMQALHLSLKVLGPLPDFGPRSAVMIDASGREQVFSSMTIFVEPLRVPNYGSRIERGLPENHVADGFQLPAYVLHSRHALGDHSRGSLTSQRRACEADGEDKDGGLAHTASLPARRCRMNPSP